MHIERRTASEPGNDVALTICRGGGKEQKLRPLHAGDRRHVPDESGVEPSAGYEDLAHSGLGGETPSARGDADGREHGAPENVSSLHRCVSEEHEQVVAS